MDYVILGLATWRISNLLVNEDGPWDIFSKLRHLAGVRYDEHSSLYSTNELSKLLMCVWCLSPYLAAVLTLAYWFWPSIAIPISLPFALSAMAVLVDKVANGSS